MNPFENIPENTSNGYNSPSSMGSHDLQARLKMSMDRQLQGTNRCIASIHETESIGYAAAEVVFLPVIRLIKLESMFI